MMWNHGWGAGSWLAMSVMMIVFWGLVIAGLLWIVRSRRAPQHQDTPSAARILDERFARGEIDAEEYRTRREHLAAR